MAEPFKALRFLYVGSDKFAEDERYYREVLGAPKLWEFHEFGAKVAAFRLAERGPHYLLADHRPPRTCMPIYEVEDLEQSVKALTKRGWEPTAGPFGIPNGDCYTFKDRTGNELAIFEDTRPGALEA